MHTHTWVQESFDLDELSVLDLKRSGAKAVYAERALKSINKYVYVNICLLMIIYIYIYMCVCTHIRIRIHPHAYTKPVQIHSIFLVCCCPAQTLAPIYEHTITYIQLKSNVMMYLFQLIRKLSAFIYICIHIHANTRKVRSGPLLYNHVPSQF